LHLRRGWRHRPQRRRLLLGPLPPAGLLVVAIAQRIQCTDTLGEEAPLGPLVTFRRVQLGLRLLGLGRRQLARQRGAKAIQRWHDGVNIELEHGNLILHRSHLLQERLQRVGL